MIVFLSSALFAAEAGKRAFDIPADKAEKTLKQFSEQSGRGLIMGAEVVAGVTTNSVRGDFTPREALDQMLAGTKLAATQDERNGAFVVHREAVPPNAPRAAPTSDRPTQNQKPEDQTLVLETFEVMGSKLLNMDLKRSRDDAQPYVIFERMQIERSGAINIEDFLKQRLTMNTVAQTYSQNLGNAFGNRSQINLRGLGSNQTLILVDGHRIGAGNDIGTPRQPDLNGIPLGAIERIEVLPTTASGIYGGNAIGGVVNVILRRDYAGAELKLTYENSFDTDTAVRRAEMSAGFTLEGGKTNVLLSASVSDSHVLAVQDRRFLRDGRLRIFANNPNFYLNAVTPPLASTPNIRSSTGTNLVLKNGTPLNSPNTFVPSGYAGVAADGGAALVANAGRYNLNLANSTQTAGGGRQGFINAPTIESFMATIRREFSPHLQMFLEVAGTNNSGYLPNSSFTAYTLPVAAPNNPFQQAIRITVPTSASDAVEVGADFSRRVVAGAIVKLPHDWRAEADYTWNWSRVHTATVQASLSGAEASLVTTGAIDVLRDPAAYTSALQAYRAYGTSSPAHSTFRDINVRLSGPIGTLPAGAPVVSALVEHRDDDFESLTETGFYAPPFYYYVPAAKQSVDSGYAEVEIPLFSATNALPGMQVLELQLAARRDDYSSRGGALIFDTAPINLATTPAQYARNKVAADAYTVGLRYQPVRDLILRASYGTGFRPPQVDQLVAGALATRPAGLYIDPRRGNTATPSFTYLSGGNANLKPEKAKSWSVGAILTPHGLDGLRLSVDYTRIDKTDNIAASFPNTFQGLIDNERYLPGRVTRGANLPGDQAGWAGPITYLDLTAVNISRAKVEAYDVALDYRRATTSAGRFDFFALATWQTHYETQLLPTAPLLENVGITSSNPLKFKGNAGVTWSRGPWSGGWTARYFDSYYVADSRVSSSAAQFLNQGARVIPSQVYHDVFVGYRFGRSVATGWRREFTDRTEIQLGVKNVLNHAPPFDVSYYFYSVYGDPRLAVYSLSFKRSF